MKYMGGRQRTSLFMGIESTHSQQTQQKEEKSKGKSKKKKK